MTTLLNVKVRFLTVDRCDEPSLITADTNSRNRREDSDLERRHCAERRRTAVGHADIYGVGAGAAAAAQVKRPVDGLIVAPAGAESNEKTSDWPVSGSDASIGTETKPPSKTVWRGIVSSLGARF